MKKWIIAGLLLLSVSNLHALTPIYGPPKTITTAYSLDNAFKDEVKTELKELKTQVNTLENQQETMIIFSVIAIFFAVLL